ncbi:MAG: class I SAM-dependent methyltransferase [Chloroflexi bacterium]|jgi:SAM-dependent methyltransferase|nr:class I SAM-dependent methyltransferase [Chloroflexota bacterium]MBT3670939.1 class I SAM-dependent methyltransferase [Chloroflexota bacterium]MBT4001693.1 class I SAM-dependent methyltransferase [Chloroflexota bacterium]MBT4306347.1 class I SAM-dependent methyltransferase [Chloroflexota bacterium]MBT4532772.1 class I SAM-dependent methyltransferase [Chloroflexota bacterium]
MLNKIFRKIAFRSWYIQTPPWDTGITPPELEAFIDTHPPGRAIDLGCGTGTNVIRLAQAGWAATGVDFIPKAIRLAKLKGKDKKVSAEFVVGDVSSNIIFSGQYDLILDIGCYHALTFDQQEKYRKNIRDFLIEGGQFLLYSFLSDEQNRRAGLSLTDLSLLESEFNLTKREEGQNEDGPSSAWFWFSK